MDLISSFTFLSLYPSGIHLNCLYQRHRWSQSCPAYMLLSVFNSCFHRDLFSLQSLMFGGYTFCNDKAQPLKSQSTNDHNHDRYDYHSKQPTFAICGMFGSLLSPAKGILSCNVFTLDLWEAKRERESDISGDKCSNIARFH